MKSITKLGVLLVVGVLSGTPVLACMLPGAVNTDEEAACCRDMASDCDQGNMPSSHSCCKTLKVPNQAVLAKAAFELLHQLSSFYIVPPNFASAAGKVGMFGGIVSIGHSPPEGPSYSSKILRI